MKKLGKIVALLLALLVAAVAGFALFLTLTEYKPAPTESLTVTPSALQRQPAVGQQLTVVTLNTGYGVLDRTQDFAMEGGKGENPQTEACVRQNMAGLLSSLDALDAQVVLLQEVDEPSSRSFGLDQVDYYRRGLAMNAAMAYNYKCEFVPFPWPPMGQVASGLVTLTELQVTSAERISLPVPFTWPVRTANLKRCLLVERVPVAGTDKELVIVNLHLEAYDDGDGRLAQTQQLVQLLEAEAADGNYVLAGGDFNQSFPNAPAMPVVEPDAWQPGVLPELPEGLRYVYDASHPTARSVSKPYSGDRSDTQLYVIDGFILSDNLKVNLVETVDLNFLCSDHNAVLLQVTLQ